MINFHIYSRLVFLFFTLHPLMTLYPPTKGMYVYTNMSDERVSEKVGKHDKPYLMMQR